MFVPFHSGRMLDVDIDILISSYIIFLKPVFLASGSRITYLALGCSLAGSSQPPLSSSFYFAPLVCPCRKLFGLAPANLAVRFLGQQVLHQSIPANFN